MNRLFFTPGISGGAWNETNSPARARLGAHGQQVLAAKADLATDNAVARMAGERQAQGALAAAVGAHEHHQRTGRDIKRD